VKYGIKVDESVKFNELIELTEKGYRFIAFQYCIAFGITLSRFSPAIFILNEEDLNKHKSKYNLITIFFGWWSLFGIPQSIQSLKVNNDGGIDMTEDILLNITEDSFNKREVELVVTSELFIKPKERDSFAMRDALVNNFKDNSSVRKVIAGLYINTEDGVHPFLTIGILVDRDFDHYTEEIKKLLYTQFTKFTDFTFIDLSVQNEINTSLEKNGEIIILKR